MIRRAATALLAAAALAGCGTFNKLSSDVSSYGSWPADRQPGSYAFERLPSQQANADWQAKLEAAAAPALQAAGFTPAADAAQAEFSVQVGARVTGYDRSPWDDPFWWRGGWAYGPRGAWLRGGPYWWGAPSPVYEREVGLLIRDRRSGQPLYEARAANDGASPSIETLLPAMFGAALADFPATGMNPRRVVRPIRPE